MITKNKIKVLDIYSLAVRKRRKVGERQKEEEEDRRGRGGGQEWKKGRLQKWLGNI